MPTRFDPTRRRALQGALALAAAPGVVHAAAPAAAAPAPDFTLRSLGGPNLRLAEQRGRVVLLNFWASWCGPCRQEMPHLNRLHQQYHTAGLVLLGVNVDDEPRNAEAAASRLALAFPVLLDTDKAVSRRYELSTMPSTVLIDREGRLRHRHRGYREGYEALYQDQVRALLKE
ncbi:MAG: TlpA family protein disulfide reductase [Burkholderiales bacterium]|nr:TlpA family protein disulfide reductase [Burkholderiales bacterium]